MEHGSGTDLLPVLARPMALKRLIGGIRSSLRWKIALITGSVLLLIHGAFSGFAIYSLNQQSSQRLEQLRFRHRVLLSHLLDQSHSLLQQVAETIPLIAENITTDGDEIIETIDAYWLSYLITWEIENIQYYSEKGRLIKKWGRASVFPPRHVGQVLSAEKPIYFISCSHTCLQYSGIPVIGRDNRTRALFLSKTLANVIIDFHDITKAQIAVVSPPERGKSGPSFKIAAVTNPKFSTPIVEKAGLAALLSPPLKRGSNSAIVSSGEKFYAVTPVLLRENGPIFISVDDITRLKREHDRNLLHYLTNALISLVSGIGILVLLLSHPLKRLEMAAQVLPLLAEGKYDTVHQFFSKRRRKQRFKDEITLLEETILQVAMQLKILQKEVDERTRSLMKQTQFLERERSFIQGLLDTAPLIILTQDKNGKIITINRYGRKLIESENHPPVYERVFLKDGKNKDHIAELLDRLRSSKTGKIKFDCPLESGNGRPRYITWFHTKLSDDHPEAPLVLSIGLDITDRKVAENRLAWLANHDPLTHLYNRRSFQDQFANLLDIAMRQGQPVALLYFDLDQFKYINDTCGHKAGDLLLQMIAERLREVTRSSDILARLGGDEFALVIYGIGEEEAVKVAEKIFSSLQSIDYRIKDHPFKITVSIGIALFPEHGHSIQELLANADLAMYQAKEAGRGCIHVYSPDAEFHERIHHEVFWKDQIQKAMDEDRFVLHFQPILDLRTNTISHYETLLRMLDPDGNVLSPDQFIPVAERTGLIRAIDKLVVDKALVVHKALLKKGQRQVLSINLSGQALVDEELQNHIYESLAAPSVEPRSIIFEITETIAVSNFASARQLMERIRSLGCSFALDDFGVGFSSFYYLMHLPVDYVKIDGSFIKKLEHSREDQVLVQALAEIAQRLGKKTVAEFVENARILELLRRYGIHYAQGYHVGRPLPHIPATQASKNAPQTI